VVGSFLERWQLQSDGPARAGAAALVLPVRRADGTAAVLKLQPVDAETAGEPEALRAWAGRGAVRLLAHDPATGTMLLERLDATRSLASMTDDQRAVQTLSGVLARLVSVPAPSGLRRLDDITGELLEQAPRALRRLGDRADQQLVRGCTAAVEGLGPVREHRLLHWDLHYDNVLAGRREPWLAIDPKPLTGEPGFELYPALRNRWDELAVDRGAARGVLRRFDLMVEVLELDRQRAAAWTLGRVLQDVLWDLAAGATAIDPAQRTIGRALLTRT
jgi:streptomycin 6-kinase